MIFGFNTDVKVGTVVYHVQSEARQKDLLLETQVFVRGQCIGKCASPFPDEPVLVDFAEDIVQQSLKAQHRRVVAAARAGTIEQELGAVTAPDALTPAVFSNGLPARVSPASPLAAPQTPASTPSFDVSALLPQEEKQELEQHLVAAVGTSVASQKHASSSNSEQAAAASTAPGGELLLAHSEGLSTGTLNIACKEAHWLEEEQSLLLVLQVHRDELPLDCAALTLRVACGQARPRYAYATSDGSGIAAVSITVDDASGRDARVLVQAEGEGQSATRRFQLHPASQPTSHAPSAPVSSKISSEK